MKNKAIPRLRFKGFHDKWLLMKLKDISKIKAGGDVNKKKLSTNGKYPVLSNGLDKSGIKGYYSDYKIKAPAITVTGRGKLGIAKARFISFTPVVRLISVQSKKLNTIFGANAINQIHIFKEYTGVPQLTAKQLKEYKINIPTLSEQQLIGKFFAKLDKLIQLQQKKVALLKKLKRGYLQKLFPRKGELVPRLRFKGFHGAWMITKLGDLLRECKKQKISNPNRYNLLTVKLHFKGVVKTDNHPRVTQRSRPYYMRYPGELIIGKQNFQHGGFGLAPKSIQNCIASSAIWSFKFRNNINKYFLLNDMSNIDWLKHTTIYLNGTGQKEYGNKTFKNLRIKKPIINEQSIIGKFFMNLNNLLKFNEVKLNELNRLKKAYLQKMFC